MATFSSKIISYRELKDGSYKNAYIPQDDKFPVTSHLTTCLRDALIACPANNDDAKAFMYVFVDDDKKEVGRVFLFGTHIRGKDVIYDAQSGLGLEVSEEYRGETVGAELMLYTSLNKEYDFTLAAGISQMILPMYRKLKYHLFEVPQFFKVRKAKFEIKSLGLKSRLSRGWKNVVLRVKDVPNHIKYYSLKKKFVIIKETIVPEWVTEMVANDGHQFMEVHDREWFQWNLDHNTYGYDEDIQAFYSIFDRENNPIGFYMTKERIIKKPGRNHGFIIGTVVEWESCDYDALSEADINLLAMHSFSKRIDAIFTLACESGTVSQLKRIGFKERASFKVGVKDKKKQIENIGDQNLWRLRYGMTNMIIL